MPDFLEKLNQGAEKTFGENAKSMIESLLKYAKIPPKLRRSVNMARLENGTYEESVAHLKLDLIALEESYDLPVVSMPHHLLIAATYCPLVLIPARMCLLQGNQTFLQKLSEIEKENGNGG